MLTQQQQIVSQTPTPPLGAPIGHPLLGYSSSTTKIMMNDSIIGISMREKNYDPPKGESLLKGPPLTFQSNGNLTFDEPSFGLPSHPSKGRLHQTTHNLNARSTQHYSIVEDLA